jgi:hypothetical protein
MALRRLAAVGAVLGLLAAACGGGGRSSPATDAVRRAPERTAAAGTSRIEVQVERKAAAAPATSPFLRMAGEVDYRSRSGHLTVDLSQIGLSGPPIDAVFEGSTVYEKLPRALIPTLPADKPWVKVDVNSAGSQLGTGVGGLSGDPSSAIEILRGATTATRVGSEEVRGTATTHYRVVVDVGRAGEQSPNLRPVVRSLVQSGVKTVPADVWLDAQGRVRRQRYTIDVGKAQAATSVPGAVGSVTFALELFDFGVPVHVSVPAASEVVDVNALGGQGSP